MPALVSRTATAAPGPAPAEWSSPPSPATSITGLPAAAALSRASPSTETEPSVPTDEVDTEAPTLAPDEHTAIIAVGLFGNEDNVQRLVQQLNEEGFAPTTTKEGKLTRVGVAVRYTEDGELQKTLNDLRRMHTESAFIMYRDGKKVADR